MQQRSNINRRSIKVVTRCHVYLHSYILEYQVMKEIDSYFLKKAKSKQKHLGWRGSWLVVFLDQKYGTTVRFNTMIKYADCTLKKYILML